MASYRCKYSLGNERYVQVNEWKGELRVDLREWQGDKPTKKGISLTLMRWKNVVDAVEFVDQSLGNKQVYNAHLGGNVYMSIKAGCVCVDIRQYWKPKDDVVPTKKGLCLRPAEYVKLKEVIPDIGKNLPELDSVVPCYLQSDHMNQMGALQCSECNPNDFMNW
ncbi:uncharacterized protein LOC132727709 [Ruditapes philippinarum]|uniref:uncharacterized protein LOC132727709 n=1 Tax=Ruditapes philippinarum TaxID=129788 RepID=UPI00295BA60D|nr:uncharacterized protein LOC132727709 [Ruditapes philippinarum]